MNKSEVPIHVGILSHALTLFLFMLITLWKMGFIWVKDDRFQFEWKRRSDWSMSGRISIAWPRTHQYNWFSFVCAGIIGSYYGCLRYDNLHYEWGFRAKKNTIFVWIGNENFFNVPLIFFWVVWHMRQYYHRHHFTRLTYFPQSRRTFHYRSAAGGGNGGSSSVKTTE